MWGVCINHSITPRLSAAGSLLAEQKSRYDRVLQ
jgi:hypothetical protein